MRKLLRKFWRDEGGVLLATEWVFVASILVLATAAALGGVRYQPVRGWCDLPRTASAHPGAR